MKPLLRRRNLSDTVGDALLEAIAGGRFGETLPAEPALAAMFGVSRVTLRAALAKLTETGVIAPHRGRRTTILKRPKASAKAISAEKRPGRILFLSPNALHELPPGVLLVLDLLRAQMERDGLVLEHRQCHAFTLTECAGALEKFIPVEPAEIYLLHLAPSPAQAWFAARGLSAIVVGTPVENAPLPGVHTDLRATARHALKHLVAVGHDAGRVGLFVPKLDLPDNRAVIAGFLEGGGSSVMIVRHPGESETLRAWIGRRDPLAATKPTAVITAWPGAALALIGTVSVRRGKTIPENLSVVCLYDDPAFGMLVPSVTRYRRAPEKYVSILSRLIRRTLRGDKPGPAESRTLFPALIKGETVAAPKG
jgi:DNA-binding LacI/PurR family transcriptional regulator